MSRLYCGRRFEVPQIELIRALIVEHPERNRAQLAHLVCEALHWQGADGRLKEMSCRLALLRMQGDGLIELPPPRNGNGNGRPYVRISEHREHEDRDREQRDRHREHENRSS